MTLRVWQVQQAVCDYYGLSRSQLTGQSRVWRVSHPRQLAMVLSLEFVPRVNLMIVGRMFGDRDHTTVLHARRAVAEREWRSPAIAHDMAVLRQSLRALELAAEAAVLEAA